MTLSTITAVLTAFAQFCSAEPSLRGQDTDQQHPPPPQVVQGGDRPVPVLPALAAPSLRHQDLDQDAEATVPQGDGRRVSVKAPGARVLQEHVCNPTNLPEGGGVFCGQCRDREDHGYDRISFRYLDSDDECFEKCPSSEQYVGYEWAPDLGWSGGRGVCICRYDPGFVMTSQTPGFYGCPADADSYWGSPCQAYASHSRGEGPVSDGTGDTRFVCRTLLAHFANDDALQWVREKATAYSMVPNLFPDWVAKILDGTEPVLQNSFIYVIRDHVALVGYATRFVQSFSSMYWTDGAAIPDVSGWNVENGRRFENMFRDQGGFNQVLSGWRISIDDGPRVNDMFKGTAMSSIHRCPCIRVGVREVIWTCNGWGPGWCNTRTMSYGDVIGYGAPQRRCPGKPNLTPFVDPSCNY